LSELGTKISSKSMSNKEISTYKYIIKMLFPLSVKDRGKQNIEGRKNCYVKRKY
jgi:hypothetical protein